MASEGTPGVPSCLGRDQHIMVGETFETFLLWGQSMIRIRRVGQWLWVLLVIAVGVGACRQAGGVATATATFPAPGTVELSDNVSPEQVALLLDRGEIVVIDVREEWEYEKGHIPGALLLPLGSLKDRMGEIPEEGPVVLVCRSGNRSAQAFRFLRQQGFTNIHNMAGGMLAWESAGLPIVQ